MDFQPLGSSMAPPDILRTGLLHRRYDSIVSQISVVKTTTEAPAHCIGPARSRGLSGLTPLPPLVREGYCERKAPSYAVRRCRRRR